MTTVEVAIPWRDTGSAERSAAWDWIRASWAARHPDWGLVVGDHEGEPFSIPAALNATIARTTADIIIVSSADGQVSADALRKAVEIAPSVPWVMPTDQLLRVSADFSARTLASPVNSTLPNTGTRRTCQLGWGVLVARREVFERVNYDERLDVAWEDSCWGYAAAVLFGEPHRLSRVSTRLLWHPKMRRYRLPGYDEATTRMTQYQAAHQTGDRAAIERLLAEGR